jgi:hypothetical protein
MNMDETWLGNTPTKWRLIAEKIVEVNGEFSSKPCLIARG